MGRRLENRDGPPDVGKPGAAELSELAQEIRQFVLQSISKTGGHL